MAPTLLHIGGGPLELPAIRWAREAGLDVVVTDADPDAPGFRLAERCEVVAEADVSGLVALARAIHADTDLVGAYSSRDVALEAVAAVGAATGTPANTVAVVRNIQDRGGLRQAWSEHGVATSPWGTVRSETEVRPLLAELGLPAIVTPIDARGGPEPRTVRDEAEALEVTAAARDRSDVVLLEGWAAGRRIGVNAFFRDGAYIPCGLFERFLSPAPHRLPIRGSVPSGLDRAERRQVHTLVERAARAIGLVIGPLKADVVWTDAGPLIVDLAPRFHDDVASLHTSPLVYGKSPVRAWFATLAEAGGPFDAMPTEPRAHGGWMAIVPEETGVLMDVHGGDLARAVLGIEDIALVRRPGHVIHDLGEESAVVGYLWARGWDAAEVHTRLRIAREQIRVEVAWQSVA